MCGIVAIRGFAFPDAVARSLDALAHRGPDGHASKTYRGATLGHTRLAIVDIAGGAQPIENEDSTIACVVSGEFYDDAVIRKDLESRGHRFRTNSDSEIAIHLYEEFGDAFVEHLRGEFALAIWDDRKKRLVCARDRFGVRPLVWTKTEGGVAIASEAKALFALGVRPRWDNDAIWLSMSLQYATPDRTIFAGIHQLPPGHMLIADERGERVTRYWDFDYPKTREGNVSPNDLKNALAESVEARMRNESGPVACTLSGGIDSSAIAAIASRKQSHLDCFSIAFQDDAYDEIAIAQRTAAHIGANLHVVNATSSALWDALPDAVAQSEGLAINLHLPAKWLLAREVKRAGHKVLLTGEGADEVLAGYAHFRRDLLSARGAASDDLARRNPASAGLMMPEGPTLDTRAITRAFGFVPSFMEAKAGLGLRASSLLSPAFSGRFRDRDPFREIAESFDRDQLRDRDRVDQASYMWSKLALTGYILRTLGDGTEMAHAVEGRVPFLDHRFFEVARAVPTEDKVRGDVEKWILRAAMKDVLPEEVIARRKHPLLAPPVASIGRDLLRSSSLPSFFDTRAIDATFDRLPKAPASERTSWDPPLMLAVTATLLARHYRLEDP